MQSPPNPHDAFFREVFSQPRHVVELLRLALPARLRAQLDLDPARVRVLSPSYVDATLRGTASDVVVEVPRRGPPTPGRPPALFLFAIEHQSGDERFIVFRQLGYCLALWTRWLKDNPGATHLPPIIPVVVHNGRRRWTSPTRLADLIDLSGLPRDVGLAALMPSLQVVLVDLAGPKFTRERLRAAGLEPVSETLLEILQCGPRPVARRLFAEWTQRLATLRSEPAGGSTLLATLCYLMRVSAVPNDDIFAAAEALPEPEKEKFMTGAEQLIEQGRQEGEHVALAGAVLRQARLRFGALPPETAARVSAASRAELERWLDAILTAERLNDLFG